jgi:hypothetical protein
MMSGQKRPRCTVSVTVPAPLEDDSRGPRHHARAFTRPSGRRAGASPPPTMETPGARLALELHDGNVQRWERRRSQKGNVARHRSLTGLPTLSVTPRVARSTRSRYAPVKAVLRGPRPGLRTRTSKGSLGRRRSLASLRGWDVRPQAQPLAALAVFRWHVLGERGLGDSFCTLLFGDPLEGGR